MRTNSIVKAFALLLFGTTLSAQIPGYVPQNGLVGWWPFNGNANDESGNSINATVSGATLTIDRFSNSNSAYSFYGSNDFISIPTTGGQFNNQQYTISYWFKTNQSASSGIGGPNVNPAIISRLNVGGPSANHPTSVDNFCIFEIGGSNHFNTPVNGGATGANSILGNVWHHIVFSVRTDSTITYLNGIKIYTNVNAGNITFQPYPIRLGRSQHTYWKDFSGELDDMGYWNRALTQQEITTLYNSCQVTFSTQPSSQTINQSQTAQFSALSSDPSATYQWQSDVGFGFQNLNNVGQYSGVNTGTLSVANVSQNNNNQPFRCIVNVGTCSDTSQTATLNVCAALTSQPANQTAAANQNVQFTATSFDPSATYQWQSDIGFGFQNLSNVGQYSGVNTGTLSVSNVSASNNNQPFRCVVSAGSCTDTSQTAVLSVNGNVSIEGHDDSEAFSIFPNPSRTQVTISFGKYANKKGHSVQIVNALGQTMYSTSISQEACLIDVSAWSGNGLYYVQILDANKEILETRTLVVQ